MKKYKFAFWRKSSQKVEPQMTQLQQVMTHLKRRGSITSWQAVSEYKITRLSAIIYRLRKEESLSIISKSVKKDSGRGSYVIYTLNRG